MPSTSLPEAAKDDTTELVIRLPPDPSPAIVAILRQALATLILIQ